MWGTTWKAMRAFHVTNNRRAGNKKVSSARERILSELEQDRDARSERETGEDGSWMPRSLAARLKGLKVRGLNVGRRSNNPVARAWLWAFATNNRRSDWAGQLASSSWFGLWRCGEKAVVAGTLLNSSHPTVPGLRFPVRSVSVPALHLRLGPSPNPAPARPAARDSGTASAATSHTCKTEIFPGCCPSASNCLFCDDRSVTCVVPSAAGDLGN
jgi:hypothetical protein